MGQNHKTIVTLRGDIMDLKIVPVNGKQKASFRFVTIKENKTGNEVKFIKNTWFAEAWGHAAMGLQNVPNMHTITVDAEFQNYSYDSDQGKKYGVKLAVIGFGGDCGPTIYADQYNNQNAGASAPMQGQGQAPQYQQRPPAQNGYQQPPPNFGAQPQYGQAPNQNPQYPPQYQQQAPPSNQMPPQQQYQQRAPQQAPPHNYAPGAQNPPQQMSHHAPPQQQMAPPTIDPNEQIPF